MTKMEWDQLMEFMESEIPDYKPKLVARLIASGWRYRG